MDKKFSDQRVKFSIGYVIVAILVLSLVRMLFVGQFTSQAEKDQLHPIQRCRSGRGSAKRYAGRGAHQRCHGDG
jgi:hypothetical protein